MPRLHDIEEKCLFGLQVDKENDEVFFNEESHTYKDKYDGSDYISATQLIGKYKQPFDENFWSSYKALEAVMGTEGFSVLKPILLQSKIWNDKILSTYNIDKDVFLEKKHAILEEYAAKRQASCTIGTAIHLEKELSFYNEDTRDLKKFGLGGKFYCEKGHYKLDQERAVYPEFLISYKFNNGLKVSGQIDLLIKDGNDIYIYDWKTNGSIDKNSFFDRKTKSYQMMRHPLNNVMDSNYWHYCLQLSLYFYLLKQINPNFTLKKLALIHIDKESRKETEYVCEYLEDDIKRMLKHYQSKTCQKDIIERDKQIVF